MEQKQKMSSTMGSDQVYFKEITPDMAFFNSLPSFTRFEYSKQLPAGGPSYFDRLQSTSGIILPTVRAYGKSTATIDSNVAVLLSMGRNQGLDHLVQGNGVYNSGTSQSSRSYTPSVEGYVGLGIGNNSYTANSSGKSYGGSSYLGSNSSSSSYQS